MDLEETSSGFIGYPGIVDNVMLAGRLDFGASLRALREILIYLPLLFLGFIFSSFWEDRDVSAPLFQSLATTLG